MHALRDKFSDPGSLRRDTRTAPRQRASSFMTRIEMVAANLATA